MNTDITRTSLRTAQEIEDLIRSIAISHANVKRHTQVDSLYTAGFLDALEAIAIGLGIEVSLKLLPRS